MSTKISKWLRLKDKHSTMVKLDALQSLARILGITLIFEPHTTILRDEDKPNQEFFLVDLDHDGEPVQDFPPALDFKVITPNPAYIEAQRLEQEAREQCRKEDVARAEEKRKLLRETEAARRKAEAEADAIKLEQDEREELLRLKLKYERKE